MYWFIFNKKRLFFESQLVGTDFDGTHKENNPRDYSSIRVLLTATAAGAASAAFPNLNPTSQISSAHPAVQEQLLLVGPVRRTGPTVHKKKSRSQIGRDWIVVGET